MLPAALMLLLAVAAPAAAAGRGDLRLISAAPVLAGTGEQALPARTRALLAQSLPDPK